jgi:hypothetical protein
VAPRRWPNGWAIGGRDAGRAHRAGRPGRPRADGADVLVVLQGALFLLGRPLAGTLADALPWLLLPRAVAFSHDSLPRPAPCTRSRCPCGFRSAKAQLFAATREDHGRRDPPCLDTKPRRNPWPLRPPRRARPRTS